MAFPRKTASVTLTTDASGDATGYLELFTGHIKAIRYTKVDFATGVDFTITTEDTAQTVWTETNVDASELIYPQANTQVTDGKTRVGEASPGVTESGVYGQPIPVVNERIKIVVANGGNTKTGSFYAIYE